MTNTSHSMASGIVLETTFGLQVQPSGQPDPFIAAAKQAVEAMTESGLFGTYLVDFLPIRESPFATRKHLIRFFFSQICSGLVAIRYL